MTTLMKTMLVALLIANSAAHAVTVDPSGKGEVLLFPYYSVNNGQQTVLTLVNHPNSGKAVKLRFREGHNGRTALSINVYLAEFDVWSASVISVPGDDRAALLTFDNSCTLPAIRGNPALPQLPGGVRYLPFSTADFNGVRADGRAADASRTREGLIEAIEMGALVNQSDSDVAATHLGGVPRDCPSLVAAWQPAGYWQLDPQTDLAPPTGQLAGTASVVWPAQGTAINADPTVLSGFSIVSQHTPADAPLPDLASAVTDPARLQVESSVLTDGVILRSHWPQARAIDAVSAVLAHASISSEFNIEPASAAETDWVISLPTRRHYVDPALAGAVAIAPFSATTASSEQPACERANLRVFDRSGSQASAPPGADGTPDQLLCLCAATQRLKVSTTAGASTRPGCRANPLSTQVGAGPITTRGLLDLGLSGYGHVSRPAMGGERYLGLPVIGFTRTSYQSRDSQSRHLRVYSSSTPQRGTVQCSRASEACNAR